MTEKTPWRFRSLRNSQNRVDEKIKKDKEKLEKLSSKITEIEPEKDFARSISSIEDSRLKYCQKDRGWGKILLVFTAHKIRIGNLRLQFRQGLTDYTHLSMITNIDLKAQFRYVPEIQQVNNLLSSENYPILNGEIVNDNLSLRSSDNSALPSSSTPLRSVNNSNPNNNNNSNNYINKNNNNSNPNNKNNNNNNSNSNSNSNPNSKNNLNNNYNNYNNLNNNNNNNNIKLNQSNSNHNSPVRMNSASNQLLQGGMILNPPTSQLLSSNSPSRLHNNQASFIIVGDFGVKDKTHLGFSAVRNEIQKKIDFDDIHYTIHLGDVYYAGTIFEEQLFENVWLPGSLGSFALNSNHEMYSGAKGYQKVLLRSPKLALQKNNHSFLLENDYWMIVGLDTAVLSSYSSLFGEGRIKDPMQVEMLHIARKSMKKIIILTHHNPVQYNGRFTTRLWDDVYKILRREPHYWYFGHEHNAIAYKVGIANTKLTRFRCAGHGAIPYLNAPIFDKEDSIFWREKTLARSELLPVRLCNGFVTLRLDDDRLIEAYINELGHEVFLPDPSEDSDRYLPQNDGLRYGVSQPTMKAVKQLSKSGGSIDDLDHLLTQKKKIRDSQRDTNQEKRRFWHRKTSSPAADYVDFDGRETINILPSSIVDKDSIIDNSQTSRNLANFDNNIIDNNNNHHHHHHFHHDGSKERGIEERGEDLRSYFRKKLSNINNTNNSPTINNLSTKPTRHRRNKSDSIRPSNFFFSNFHTPQVEKKVEKDGEKKEMGEKERSGILSAWFEWRDRDNKGSKEIQKDQRRHRRGTSRDLDRERDNL